MWGIEESESWRHSARAVIKYIPSVWVSNFSFPVWFGWWRVSNFRHLEDSGVYNIFIFIFIFIFILIFIFIWYTWYIYIIYLYTDGWSETLPNQWYTDKWDYIFRGWSPSSKAGKFDFGETDPLRQTSRPQPNVQKKEGGESLPNHYVFLFY